jgi:hypothetical protein
MASQRVFVQGKCLRCRAHQICVATVVFKPSYCRPISAWKMPLCTPSTFPTFSTSLIFVFLLNHCSSVPDCHLPTISNFPLFYIFSLKKQILSRRVLVNISVCAETRRKIELELVTHPKISFVTYIICETDVTLCPKMATAAQNAQSHCTHLLGKGMFHI